MNKANKLIFACEKIGSDVFKLEKELELKQKGSSFKFPKGTIVAIVTLDNKRYSANSHTKTTVDALTGKISATVFLKLQNVSKNIGDIPKNAKLLKSKLNPNMIAGPIASVLNNVKDKDKNE